MSALHNSQTVKTRTNNNNPTIDEILVIFLHLNGTRIVPVLTHGINYFPIGDMFGFRTFLLLYSFGRVLNHCPLL